MATHMTSLLRSERKRANSWVRMCGCRFATAFIASLQHASMLFIRPRTASLHARLAGSKFAIAVLTLTPADSNRVRTNFTSVSTKFVLVATR